ncbi:potassium/proton antiporter [Nakamurella flava]|uniref:Potassium/proton antiporter n=1 Tax=Nakamurella flava TaxID=2576308 RepID=A0A4U6QJ43_9ACTN|nr:potassium/proton antiporter [Nakamurella flava]TKV60484.1 potassium/proton antiporter [Nakamurella flava]
MDLETVQFSFGLAALVLLLALVAIRLSRRLGTPSLLLYLGIGLALGNGGIGIDFSDTIVAEQVGLAALVFILAEGGLTTRWSNVRPALGLGISLSTVAVAVSVVVAGLGVHLVMGFDWRTSLLWGAVLSSTDAAAVFSVLRGVGVKSRLSAALELESGLNDAPVVIAVLLLTSTAPITWTAPFLVVYELAAGAVIGAALGFGGAWVLRRAALPAAGLYPLAALGLAGGAYAVGAYAHASGFLATYVCALILGNSRLPHRASTISFAEGFGWIAQIGLFVMLGLYVDPFGLPDAIIPGIVIGLIVLLLSRPLSIVAAATPFRMTWKEQAFLSWSGLRGAVPIVLAMIPLTAGQPTAALLLDVIVVVVVIYTLLQGTTLPWVARRLGVVDVGKAEEVQVDAAPLEEMDAHVLQVTVPPGSKLHGVYVAQLRLPQSATIGLLLRNGEPMDILPTLRIQSGDQLLVLAPERVRSATEERLREVSSGGALARWFRTGPGGSN